MLDIDKLHYKAQVVLSVIAVLTFSLVLGALVAAVFIGVPQGAEKIYELLMLVLGALIVIYKDVYGFWLGSSAGSVRKSIATGEPSP